jgi:hypothetical protein
MSDSPEKRAWITRVLGFSFAKTQGGGRPRPKLLPIWMDAKERVDSGIEKLQHALRDADDEDLAQIAEFGLYGATEGETVRLMAALREADTGADGALDKLREAVSDYRDFLEGAPIVDLIEDNPFGVAVPLRHTLGAALDELERAAA